MPKADQEHSYGVITHSSSGPLLSPERQRWVAVERSQEPLQGRQKNRLHLWERSNAGRARTSKLPIYRGSPTRERIRLTSSSGSWLDSIWSILLHLPPMRGESATVRIKRAMGRKDIVFGGFKYQFTHRKRMAWFGLCYQNCGAGHSDRMHVQAQWQISVLFLHHPE